VGEEEELSVGAGEENVRRNSLEVIREERENANGEEKIDTNVEHRTSNVELRTEEDCGGEPEHDAQGLPPDASETPVSETPVSETPASSVRMRFVFYGGGARKAEVEQFVREHPQCPVEVHDYAPADRLGAHLRSADVHLASLDAAWTGTMVPSKLQGIFQAGRPVVFIGSAASSIGRWVLESGGGWVVPPGDVAGLLAALDEARDPDARASRGRAARAFAVRNFDKATNVARIISCLTAERMNEYERRMNEYEHRTSNVELRTEEGERNRQNDRPFSLRFDVGRSMLNVRCSHFLLG
jgi:hypothetical protein